MITRTPNIEAPTMADPKIDTTGTKTPHRRWGDQYDRARKVIFVNVMKRTVRQTGEEVPGDRCGDQGRQATGSAAPPQQ